MNELLFLCSSIVSLSTIEILEGVGFGSDEYTLKVNSRKILDGMFECCGVPEASFRPISSAVDKLGKHFPVTLSLL